jgi:hypothetical protein
METIESAKELVGNHFTVRGNPGQRFMPYWQIAEEEFTCYPTITAMA